jgi:hypothetical protein
MQCDCHVTMEMQQTHCHTTVPVALLWKCYKDLTCHNIYNYRTILMGKIAPQNSIGNEAKKYQEYMLEPVSFQFKL